jgi:hypothetical protein
MFVMCCTGKTKEEARTIKKKKQVRKDYKERRREGIKRNIPPGGIDVCLSVVVM